MSLDAVMPQNVDAERQVLGALLASPAAWDDVAALRPADFYRPGHEELFRLMAQMRAEGAPTEPQAVGDRLRTAGLASVDWDYMYGLFAGLVVAANAGYYADRVREAADLRAVVTAGTRMVQAGAESQSAADAKQHARKLLDEIDVRDSHTVQLGDVLGRVLDDIEGTDSRPVTPSPWPELDDAVTGLRPGTLVTVGGRPGTGKSLAGQAVAWSVALSGKTALMFSLEMSEDDVTRRLVSAASSVDYGRILRRNVNAAEWDRISKATGALATAPLHIDDRSGITVNDIAATCRHVARTADLGVVVVDYLQLMTPVDRRVPREQQVAESSRALKILAGDLGVPILMLSQLNRAVEGRADKHPTLADLRESGAVEQDSDVVLLLFRDDQKAPEFLDVGVAKNRFGAPTSIRLRWEGQFQRLSSPTLNGSRPGWTPSSALGGAA